MICRLVDAGNHAVWLYRASHWWQERRWRPCRWIAYFLYRINLFLTGADIPPTVTMGTHALIPHPVGVVIGRGVVLGDHVKIMSGVVLGLRTAHFAYSDELFPIIGSRVFLGANSVVLGPVTIGDDCLVGAGTVVTTSVPHHSVVTVGTPSIRPRVPDAKELTPNVASTR